MGRDIYDALTAAGLVLNVKGLIFEWNSRIPHKAMYGQDPQGLALLEDLIAQANFTKT